MCVGLPSSSSDPDIVNGVYWSEALNKVFVDNFERDPTLIWQYFGSAKGFFRQYPGECCLSVCRLISLCFCVCVCVCVRVCGKRKAGLKGAISRQRRGEKKQIRTNDLELLKG